MEQIYPRCKIIGEFPEKHLKLLEILVRKRKAELTSLRDTKGVQSDSILRILWPDLEKAGYKKKRWSASSDSSFEMDGTNQELKIGLEIEKGRVILGNQIFLDLYKFLINPNIEYGVLIVPVSSREGGEKPFNKTTIKLGLMESKIEGHQSLLSQIPLKGVLIIGY